MEILVTMVDGTQFRAKTSRACLWRGEMEVRNMDIGIVADLEKIVSIHEGGRLIYTRVPIHRKNTLLEWILGGSH